MRRDEVMLSLDKVCPICGQDVYLGSGENLDIEGTEYMQDYLICSPQCPNDGKWVEDEVNSAESSLMDEGDDRL